MQSRVERRFFNSHDLCAPVQSPKCRRVKPSQSPYKQVDNNKAVSYSAVKKKKHIPFLIILIDRLVRVLAYSCRLLRSDSLHNRSWTVHLNAESVEGMHNNAAMDYTLALKPCYCMHSRTYIQMQQTIMERSRSYAKPIQANLHVKLQRAMFARFRKIAWSFQKSS